MADRRSCRSRTNADDRLPRMFYEEPLPPHNTVVVVDDEAMEKTFDF